MNEHIRGSTASDDYWCDGKRKLRTILPHFTSLPHIIHFAKQRFSDRLLVPGLKGTSAMSPLCIASALMALRSRAVRFAPPSISFRPRPRSLKFYNICILLGQLLSGIVRQVVCGLDPFFGQFIESPLNVKRRVDRLVATFN